MATRGIPDDNLFNDQETEVFKQVGISLQQTLAPHKTSNRPVHDLPQIYSGLTRLGNRHFESRDNTHKLNLELKVNLVPDESRTAVSAIILSIQRQKIGIDIAGVLGRFFRTILKRPQKTTAANPNAQDSFLHLTPNGYQITSTEATLKRQQRQLQQYTPEAEAAIGACFPQCSTLRFLAGIV